MTTPSTTERIVITGVGLAAPGADSLATFRANLLAGKSGVSTIDLRYMGTHPAGLCSFDETKYRKKRENKRGTRAGCIGVYCAGEALTDAGINASIYDPARTGIYVGLTEHGTVKQRMKSTISVSTTTMWTTGPITTIRAQYLITRPAK